MPEGLATAWGASVGTAVGAGAAFIPFDGTAVGAAAALGAGADDHGTAVAEDPQARIAASRSAKGPRIRSLGCLKQRFKMD